MPQPDVCTEPIDIFKLLEPVDVVLCNALVTLAPTVNAIDPDIVWINPTYGDVYLLDVFVWDCPPYGVG